MSSQDLFGLVAMFYAVANLASMGLELELRETIRSLRSVRILGLGVCSRNGGAMFVAITAFPQLDPRLLVMILLAVPIPAIVWFALSRLFAARAGETSAEGTP